MRQVLSSRVGEKSGRSCHGLPIMFLTDTGQERVIKGVNYGTDVNLYNLVFWMDCICN